MIMVKEIYIEPLTRIEGHLAIHAVGDLDKKKYVDAHSYAVMFRGFEIILKNREPADAIWITQRICGVCPTPHGLASVQCIDMTYNVSPPPFAVAIRNFIHISEQLYDAILGCGILEGPDYSEPVVKKLNPDWWDKAKDAAAENRDLHGYGTIADIMTALTPLKGTLWLRCLQMSKMGRKMAALLGGKHPHVNSFVPGGVAKTVTASDLEMFSAMLSQHIAFAKEFVSAFDDLLNFVLEMGYEDAGKREANLISYGSYDDPYAYTGKYEDLTKWGDKRKVTPGVVIKGNLVTTDLTEINLGIREFITHSYYEEWEHSRAHPLISDLSIWHPWNKETKPAPSRPRNWDGKYSWGTAPRWEDWKKRVDGKIHVVEAGPIARMWTTASAQKVDESTGTSVKFTLPKATVAGFRVSDEMTFEWKIPKIVNAVERIRARAYYHAYSAYVAYNALLEVFEMIKKGETKIWSEYKRPKEGIGVGLTEAMRGALGHWCIMKGGKIYRYQVITPSTWNESPRDINGAPGPYEDAIIGTPITEQGEELDGIDVVRVVRSFDPCLACSVHVYNGRSRKESSRKVISPYVNL
ncbi:MAG: cytochrome C [Thermoproteota archaeon]|nr:MAG: cytochrome C [Candidatus Korarchaeota archaeon]